MGRERIRAARERRQWSYHAACQRMDGVEPQQLRNIEADASATRETDLGRLRAETVVELIRCYWPDVNLSDFLGEECLFRVVPLDSNARKKILRASTG